MASEEIPPDILEAARKVYIECRRGDYTVKSGDTHVSTWQIHVARAILAERQRCAEIARTATVKVLHSLTVREQQWVASELLRLIAAAIEKGEQ